MMWLYTNGTLVCIRRTFSMTHTINSNIQYCCDHVRKCDYENFLSTCLYPSNIRTAAFAIRAFNVEIAQIRDMVSDRNTGRMRFQFWRDTLQSIYKGSPPQTPIALELHRAINRHNLSKKYFENIIEARADLLNDFPFKDMAHLGKYCDATSGAVLYLILECLGVCQSSLEKAAYQIGQVQGIVTLLRGVPYNASKSRVYLPLDVMRENKVAPALVGRWTGKHDDRVQRVVYSIATAAFDHIAQAKALSSEISQNALPLSLTLLICERYLASLKSHNFYVFHPKLHQRDHFLPFRLWLRSFKTNI